MTIVFEACGGMDPTAQAQAGGSVSSRSTGSRASHSRSAMGSTAVWGAAGNGGNHAASWLPSLRPPLQRRAMTQVAAALVACVAVATISWRPISDGFEGAAWALPMQGSRFTSEMQASADRASRVLRRASIDGPFGVLPESPSPIVDTTQEEDPIWEAFVMAVQSADQKRGLDMSAFWIHEGWDIVLLVTALSRPQLQAIANEIDVNMRKKLRMKRIKHTRWPDMTLRQEASAGWVCMSYPRLTVHVMTPMQRSYYDIEAIWKNHNQDYSPIENIEQVLREDSFGTMRLTKEIGMEPDEEEEDYDETGVPVDEVYASGGGGGGDFEEEDEDDPFWD
eukprot:TRINITY_DN30829_c0_g1_i1.p1 TRINITY_DN30829_c0_g1~~TRINITY_DN30829_c0_g1_i1.p1  ORF type:complete len:336 (-),score=73.53 TRINITY_DN30829_c0_g1_i1:152-1159(-)